MSMAPLVWLLALFITACARRNTDVIRLLLSQGASHEATDSTALQTPLHIAAEHGKLDHRQWLRLKQLYAYSSAMLKRFCIELTDQALLWSGSIDIEIVFSGQSHHCEIA